MANKKFFSPFVLLGLDPGGDESGQGGGSNQGGVTPLDPPNPIISGPMKFSDWQKDFASDVNLDGSIDFADYGQWWADKGYSMDAWAEFNPNVSFSWGPGITVDSDVE